MCGRYAQFTPITALASHFQVDEVRTEPLPARFNVAPTLEVYSVIERKDTRRLGTLRWGFVPPFAKDATGSKSINARAETLTTAPMFRDAFAKRRCLLPADVFYEWKARGPGKRKQPFAFQRTDGAPMAFAGLWSWWRDKKDPDAEPVYSCAIVTTKADDVVGKTHDRMPVVLEADEWERWLDEDFDAVEELRGLLVPRSPSPLVLFPVSPLVSDGRNEGPDLLERVELEPDDPAFVATG